jgi:hypothetical protein
MGDNGQYPVVYMVGHAGALTQSLIHRLTKNKDENAILIYGNENLIGPVFNHLEKLESEGLFSKVIHASECYGHTKVETVEECEKKIVEYYDKILSKNNINLSEIKSWYVGIDTLNSYGIFLDIKGKEYHFLEGPKNFFMVAQQRVNSLEDSVFKIYKKVMTAHGASDANKENVFRVIRPDSEVPVRERLEIFDFENEVYNIDPVSTKILLDLFGLENIPSFDKGVDVIITCSQWVLRNYQDVKKRSLILYQLLADYFIKTENSLIIKPHPLSRVTSDEFRNNFDGTFALPCEFPSNFIPLLKEIEIENAYTLSSSGLGTISPQKNAVAVGFSFYKMHRITPQLDFLLNMYKSQFGDCELSHLGMSNEFVESNIKYNLCADLESKWFSTAGDYNNQFCMIDDVLWNGKGDMERLTKNILAGNGQYILSFINSKRNNFFISAIKNNINLLDNFEVIMLKKEALRTNVIQNLAPDYIFFYSPNEEMRKKIRCFSYEKLLRHAGIKITTRTLKKNEIKALAHLLQNLDV